MRLLVALFILLALCASAESAPEKTYKLVVTQEQIDLMWRLAGYTGPHCDMSDAGLQFCRDTEDAQKMFRDFGAQITAQGKNDVRTDQH